MRNMKKILSFLLVLSMVLSYVPMPALAEEITCTHHTHDESCGFVEGVSCGHVHGEGCGDVTVTSCAHVHGTAGCTFVAGTPAVSCHPDHNEDCGYVAGVACECDLSEGREHLENCGYVAAVSCNVTHEGCGCVAEVPASGECNHSECTAESGCVTTTFVCAHTVHEDCGYVEAKPCTFDPAACEACKAIGNQSADWCGNSLCSQEDNAHAPACEQYVRTYEDCKCVLSCAEEGLNEYCETCFFEGVAACNGGEDEAAAYAFIGDTTLDYSISGQRLTITNTSNTSAAMPDWTATNGSTHYQRTPWYNSRKGINQITFVQGITSIGDHAFRDFENLLYIDFPKPYDNNLTSIGESAFQTSTAQRKEIRVFNLPSSLTSIGSNAFSGLGLKTVTIPDSVTSMGTGVLSNCQLLTSATLSSGLTTIPDKTFQNCSKLNSVTIPANVTSIGHAAFQNCQALTSITIPANINSIADMAFMECKNLNTVEYLGTTAPSGTDAFVNCPSLTYGVKVPVGYNSTTFAGANAYTYIIKAVANEPGRAHVITGADGYVHGETVTLTAMPEDGYQFVHWTENGDTVSTDATYTFIAEADCNLTAVFEEIPDAPMYAVNIGQFEKGMVTTGQAEAAAGVTVTLTVTPDNHCQLVENSLTVTDADGNPVEVTKGQSTEVKTEQTETGSYATKYITTFTFTMPAKDVTVSAEFEGQTYWIIYTWRNDDPDYAYTHGGWPMNYVYGEGVKLTNDLVPAGEKLQGYKFMGWCRHAAEGSPVIMEIDKETFGTVNLTPVFHKHEYTYTQQENSITVSCNGSYMDSFEFHDDQRIYDLCKDTTFTLSAPESLVYDGSPKDAVLTYDNWTLGDKTKPTIAYSGETDRTNVTGKEITASIELGGKTVSVSWVNEKANTSIIFNGYAPSKTYDGVALENPTESELTISGAAYSDVTFTWYKDSVDEANKLTAAPKDAGTYYVVASIAETANVKESSATSDAITIHKLDITDDAVITLGSELTYNGQLQTQTVTEVKVSDVVVDDYTLSGNTGTNVNTYTLSIEGKGNFTGTATKTWSIGKAVPSHTTPSDLTATYGETLANVNLPNGWEWEDPNTSVGNVGSNAFPAVFTPTDLDNYSTVKKDLTVVVTPKEVTVTGITAANREYNGTTLVQLTGGTVNNVIRGDDVSVDLSKAVASMADANVGTGKAVTITGVALSGADAGNYTLTAQPTGVTVNISKANATAENTELTITNRLAKTYTVDLTALLPALETGKSYGDVSYTVAAYDLQGYNSAAPTITDGILSVPIQSMNRSEEGNLGTITISFTSDNYTISNATITVKRTNKAAATITGVTAASGLTYTGNAQSGYTGTPAVQGYTGTFDVIYTGTGNTTYGPSTTAPTNAGTYSVKIAIPETHETLAGETTQNFTIAKATVTITAEDKTAVEGDAKPVFTYKVNGLKGNDKVSTAPTMTCAADMSKDGKFAITPSNAVIKNGDVNVTDNYNITYVAGELIVYKKHDVKIASVANGTVSVSPKKAAYGTQVTISVTPKSGYKLSTLTVKDAAGNSYTVSTDNNGKYYFTMPNAEVTVTATFSSTATADPTNPKTGDDFQLVLWTGMAMTSLLGAAALILNKKFYQR